MNVTFPTVEQVLFIHDYLIETTGGHPGLRDLGLLISAVVRPFQGYGEHQLYPDLPSKTAALMEGIIRNRAFIDGNKRTGLTAADIALTFNGWQLTASNQQALDVAYVIAEDKPNLSVIVDWLTEHSAAIKYIK